MPAIAIAAGGALLVAVVFEVNPQIGGPLLVLVLLALLGAAYSSGYLQQSSVFTRAGASLGTRFGNLTPSQAQAAGAAVWQG